MTEVEVHNDTVDKIKNSLIDNKFNIYFYVPPINTPSGGMGVVLRLAKHLSDDGFSTKIVYEPIIDEKASLSAYKNSGKSIELFSKFDPKWVDFDISNIDIIPLGDKELSFSDGSKYTCESLKLNLEDIFIIPEGFPDIMRKLSSTNCKRVVLAQSWAYIMNGLNIGETWQSFGIKDVISVSDAITEYLDGVMPGLEIKKINQCIDRDIFKKPLNVSDKTPTVVYTVNRGEETQLKIHNIIKNFYAFYPHLRWVRFIPLYNLSRREFADRLSKAAIAMYIDDIAGFGTFPLEAMACNTHVVGWASFGGKEYINANNGFWSNTGDVFAVSEQLGVAIDQYISRNLDFSEVEKSYESTLSPYTKEGEKNKIINIINEYKNERIKELESIKK